MLDLAGCQTAGHGLRDGRAGVLPGRDLEKALLRMHGRVSA
jgi:hypothetical protein